MNSRYLKIAWRNQWKHKGAFLINVIGLSVALAAVFFISLWVRDELSVDKFHEKDSQLYQVMEVGHANNSVNVLENTQGLFPPMVVQMCAIGEESGALDHMLEKTAEHYEREVDSTVARLSTLLEPFIMVVLGLLIGGLVMALYLPIFQLGQVV